MTRRSNVVSFRRRPKRRRRNRGWYARFRRTTIYMYVRLFVTCMLVPVPAILVGEAIAFVGIYFGPSQGSSDCKVSRVIDGDTVALWCSTSGGDRGRITGIDTPELFSPGCVSEAVDAYQAKLALQGILWAAERLEVRASGTDRYERRLITILADGKNVADAMVVQGHARRYSGGQRKDWC